MNLWITHWYLSMRFLNPIQHVLQHLWSFQTELYSIWARIEADVCCRIWKIFRPPRKKNYYLEKKNKHANFKRMRKHLPQYYSVAENIGASMARTKMLLETQQWCMWKTSTILCNCSKSRVWMRSKFQYFERTCRRCQADLEYCLNTAVNRMKGYWSQFQLVWPTSNTKKNYGWLTHCPLLQLHTKKHRFGHHQQQYRLKTAKSSNGMDTFRISRIASSPEMSSKSPFHVITKCCISRRLPVGELQS